MVPTAMKPDEITKRESREGTLVRSEPWENETGKTRRLGQKRLEKEKNLKLPRTMGMPLMF